MLTISEQETISLYNESGMDVPLTHSDLVTIAQHISEHEGVEFEMIEMALVDEDAIQQVNRKHLNHNYPTDVITFPYHEIETPDEEADEPHTMSVEATLYLCPQVIKEQAEEYNAEFEDELRRVAIHGMLHLAGYDDTTDELKEAMRERENYYLERISHS